MAWNCQKCVRALHSVAIIQVLLSLASAKTLLEALHELPENAPEIRLSDMSLTGNIPENLTDWFKEMTVLDLSSNSLEGPIPESLGRASGLVRLALSKNMLSGPLPVSISNWTKLEYISLDDNRFTGALPAAVGSWKELQYFKISKNSFSGHLPPEIGNWSKVTVVDGMGTDLTGPLPPEVGNWGMLEFLAFGDSRLSGSLPPEVGKWKRLKTLLLYNCQLTGSIPREVGAWEEVEEVILFKNQLTGSIPPEVGAWRKVKKVMLAVNQLTGSIPPEVGNWTDVDEVILEKNQLTGMIPREVGAWARVERVYLAENQLTGGIPLEVGAWEKVERVDLQKNQFTGNIPVEVGAWEKVERVYLQKNQFTGNIPVEVGNWSNAIRIYLNNNDLTGSIPPEVGLWTEVEKVLLHENRLTGSIPREVGNWKAVRQVDMASNLLTGGIPREVGNWTQVEEVELDGNQLTGTIPREVGHWTQLEIVDLSNNQLHGSIPPETGAWKNCIHIQLQSNQLSGHIPSEVGNWSNAVRIYLNSNNLTGSIPPEVGMWTMAQKIQLYRNQLTGAIPEAVHHWSRATQIFLYRNNLSGEVPAGIGGWLAATSVLLNNNQITGRFPEQVVSLQNMETLDVAENRLQALPNMTALSKLKYLFATSNLIHSIVGLPNTLVHLDLSWNQLPTLPEATYALKELEILKLNDNLISKWPLKGVIVDKIITGRSSVRCGRKAVEERFEWAKLTRLDVSNNAMNMTARNFLDSLAYVHSISELECRNCSLGGVLIKQVKGFADDQLHTGEKDCTGIPAANRGFGGLTRLDLSNNSIEALEADPPFALMFANLAGNGLKHLGVDWFNEDGSGHLVDLKVHSNKGLRTLVLKPGGRCKRSGELALVTDPDAYYSHALEGYECSSLCPGPLTKYAHDSELNESSLCRCRAGFQGQGKNCSLCPQNTYSFFEATDVHGLVRECRPCPAGSVTDGAGKADISACKCPAGGYLDASAGLCELCPQWPFRCTEDEGQVQASACSCNSSYTGLKEADGFCGCDDGHYMNHLTMVCEACTNAELCFWGTDLSKSVGPPKVKAGFWAEPVGEQSKFAGNSVWRCVNTETCGTGGVCAEGRRGRACGICEPGKYGSPKSGCDDCGEDFTKVERRWMLAAGILSITVPVIIMVHVGLTAGGEGFGFFSELRAVRSSQKIIVKHLQTVSVIGGLSVAWPPLPLAFFQFLDRFTLKIPSVLAVGCLVDEADAEVEMAAKWLMLPVFVLLAVIAIPVSRFLAWVLRALPCRMLKSQLLATASKIAMEPSDALRVCLFALTLFWSTLVANSFEMLTCSLSPNGVLTVATYPHIECDFFNSKFRMLAIVAVLNVIMYLVLPLKFLHRAYHTSTETLAMTLREDRGWYSFLFEDFRDGHLLWLVHIMVRDSLFPFTAAALPGQGAAQLLLVAAISGGYGVWVMQAAPFHDRSNSLLESWNCASAALLCVYALGMGYEQTAGKEGVEELFEDGADDPTYQSRAIGMVGVQVITIAIPCGVILYEIICAIESTRRLLPHSFQPVSKEDNEEWLSTFARDMDMDSNHKLVELLNNCDMADMHLFRSFVHQTPATIGMDLTHKSWSHLVKVSRKMSVQGHVLGSSTSMRSTNSKLSLEKGGKSARGTEGSMSSWQIDVEKACGQAQGNAEQAGANAASEKKEAVSAEEAGDEPQEAATTVGPAAGRCSSQSI